MGEFKTIFDAVYRDYVDPALPVLGPAKPAKLDIRAIGQQLDDMFADVASAQDAALVSAETWSALQGFPTGGRTVGDTAEVIGPDAGSHTDPVVGGTVANMGRYRWSASPAGWKRIGDALSTQVADATEALEAATEQADELAAARNTLFALIYNADYAYATDAEFAAADPDPDEGKIVILYDRGGGNPGIRYVGDGSAWVQDSSTILPWARYIDERALSLLYGPNFWHWKTKWNSGAPNDGIYGILAVDIDAGGTNNFNPGSYLQKVTKDGENVYILGLSGEYIGTAEDFVGYENQAGVLALVSRPDTSGSGTPARLVGLVWNNPLYTGEHPNSVQEVFWGGKQRVHHVAPAAYVISALNGRYEREGYGARLSYVFYENGTAEGKTVDFNDTGQTVLASPIVSFSTTNTATPDAQKLISFSTLSGGGTYTEKGYVTGDGRLNIKTVEVVATLTPFTDNNIPLGSSSKRWSQLYAGSATINTSDARIKTEVVPLTEREAVAGRALLKEIGLYQFLDAVAEKGADKARRHVGLTVQRAIEVMEAHDLDPFAYSFICHDTWEAEEAVWSKEAKIYSTIGEDEDPATFVPKLLGVRPAELQRPSREAGDLYSFRTEGLTLFMLAGLAAKLDL